MKRRQPREQRQNSFLLENSIRTQNVEAGKQGMESEMSKVVSILNQLHPILFKSDLECGMWNEVGMESDM